MASDCGLTSSKEIKMSFKKIKRSYRTDPGWRLATFQEVTDNLENIKEQGLLERRDIVRLLDGWISGPCYDFQMGNNFRFCMGYMLVIQVYTPANCSSHDPGMDIYNGVSLTEEGKQVALLLCAYDWNFEVVNWLLNSWDTREKMDRIPLNNDFLVKELNDLINDLARKLSETSVGDKASNKKLTLGSVKEVLCETGFSSLKNLTEYQTNSLLGRKFQNSISFFSQEVGNYWFRAFGTYRDSAYGWWDLMWEHFCTFFVVYLTQRSLEILINKLLKDICAEVITSQRNRNFILSSSVLYYITQLHKKFLLEGKRETYNTTEKIIRITCDENFNVLDQILLVAAREGDAIIMKKMLDCGAHALSRTPNISTALHVAFLSIQEHNKIEEMVKFLMDTCDAKEQLANAQDEEGKTVLHFAALEGKANICKLLLDYGARPDARDNRGRLPLHHAVEQNEDAAIDVLINVSDQESIEMLSSRDSDGKSPFDLAVDQNNIKLMAKLLPILNKPIESYFHKVDTSKLLRQFAELGNIDIVGKLLEKGARPLDVDAEGKTALHCAAMCENYSRGLETIDLILEKCQDWEKLISKSDKKGKTALHALAFMGVPYSVPKKFEGSVAIKDRDGRSPLYDATEGNLDEPDTIDVIMKLMDKKHISLDHLIDNACLTPLHVAASLGKVFQVDCLLKYSKYPKEYVKRADYLGETALHKAAKGRHLETIKVLLHWGAHPLLERDCDGKTALHFAVQTETGADGIAVAELLLKKCGSRKRQLLLLCASAAGSGTADQNLRDYTLKEFLLKKRAELAQEMDDLVREAACMGNIKMTKELLRSADQIAVIQDKNWRNELPEKMRFNVEKVLDEIQTIAELGNDRPAISDSLGRANFAHGLAAFLLNPYLQPPIAIGISGSWGMGQSSLMVQTEIILLKTAAQSALLPNSKSPSSIFPGVRKFELSKVGQKKYMEIKRWVNLLRNKEKLHTASISAIIKNFRMWISALTNRKIKESPEKQPGDSLVRFLNNYELHYHKIFKSLAAIDSSGMFTASVPQSHSRSDSPSEGSVPSIITVQYNAWKYRSDSEALAGMAVEITKEMEGIMTEPQWLSTCWRNTWRKQKQTILVEVIFPCLLAVFLAGAFTWIVWVLLDTYNVKEGENLKYASLPATIVITVWTVVKSVMSTVSPVLSAINLVLAVCEISAVVGMDKAMMQRAIIKMYGDEYLQNSKELVDKYLQKIIQLPLDLPDPSEDESNTFLESQLGVFTKQRTDDDGETESEVPGDRESEDPDYDALFPMFEIEGEIVDLGDHLKKIFRSDALTQDARETKDVTQMERDSYPQTDAGGEIAIVVTNESDANAKSAGERSLIPRKEKAHMETKGGESIRIRDMLFVRYSEEEHDAFCYFLKMDTDWRKLPRQRKCLLYYHRLIWYIFSMSKEARSLDGWQVQLITWIFLCWEWEENMNILIQNWKRIEFLKNFRSEFKSGSSGPSLRAIVESYRESEDKDESNREPLQLEATGKEKVKKLDYQGDVFERSEEGDTASKKLEGVMTQMDVSIEAEDNDERSKREIDILKAGVKGQMITGTDAESSNKGISEMLDDVVKTFRNELEEVKKEIRYLKETKQQTGKNNTSDEKEQRRRNNWRRMKRALKKYNVSMKGIQAFQRYRFHCVPGYLPWPLPKEETEDS